MHFSIDLLLYHALPLPARAYFISINPRESNKQFSPETRVVYARQRGSVQKTAGDPRLLKLYGARWNGEEIEEGEHVDL